MSKSLLKQAILKFVIGILLVGLIIFLPAGTLSFWNGWLFLSVLFIPLFIIGAILLIKNPELLKRRLNAKETRGEQGIIVKLSGVMFLLGFVLAGLDYRFDWFFLPHWVSVISSILFLISYSLYAEVLRENTYLSRTIEVQEDQKVVDTGMYGIIRHPMYTVTILMFLSIPLILGSVFSFVIFLFYPLLIVKRIKDEEEFLEKELKGYIEYKEKVKYRLFPYIW